MEVITLEIDADGCGDCSLNSLTMRPLGGRVHRKFGATNRSRVARIAGPRDRRGGIQLPACANWRLAAKDRDQQRGEAEALKVLIRGPIGDYR